MKKALILVLGFIAFGEAIKANESPAQQDTKQLSLYANIDLLSSHVWRGGKSGDAPSIEPLLEVSWGNLTVGTWAAATFDKAYKELDLYAIYSINDFSIGVFDYYCPPAIANEVKFTDFKKSRTQHLYSIDISFNGTKKLPLKLTASTMMYGMDYNSQTGAYYFSTYLESQYTKSWKNNTVSATIGLTTHEGIYYHKTAIVNTELTYKKTFDLKYCNLPVFAKMVHNPATSNTYIIGGISINRGFNM